MRSSPAIPVLAIAIAVSACAAPADWNGSDALAATTVEARVDAQGHWIEVEYHIPPSQVPDAVRAAMDRLHPGGAFTDAEKEMHDGVMYYELSRKVKGMEVEAMFTVGGVLFQEELQVAADSVPQAVRAAALSTVDQGQADKWEEIRDGRRQLVEYHVKISQGKAHYKVIVSLAGVVRTVLREIPAELEVPTGTR